MGPRFAALLALVLLLIGAAVSTAGDPQEGSGLASAAPREPDHQTAGSSQECLTCHDGTNGPAVMPHECHAVAVAYEAARLRGHASLRPVDSPSGLGGSIAEDLLIAGRVECSSCHTQHPSAGPRTEIFTIPVGGSRLCLTCHDK